MLRRSPRRPISRLVAAALAIALVGLVHGASAQQLQMPGDTAGIASDAGPMGGDLAAPTAVSAGPTAVQYGGAYFNPTLGAHLRARYTTRSYGQEEGTLDLGTMRLMEVDGGIAFLDGQVTMNDDSGVGYNLGFGYRWITLPLLPYGPDSEKIAGVSIWSDGQTIGQENFFPQLGVSMELLGERLDFRANGYIPLGPSSRNRELSETGSLTYTGNNLVNELIGIRDTAISVGEAELAGRILNLDAWLFGGVYGLNGSGVDAVGGKIGLRGYATPDLLLSIAVANDDEFDTNALFTATWFIGRTRAENAPNGTLRDRFREPVLRNNYVATRQTVIGGTSSALLDSDGDEIRVVHVDSRTGSGGDGTFENPYSNLNLANQGAEQEGDILLVHAGSTYTDNSITLLNQQRLLGEGLFNDPTLGATLIRHDVTLLGGDVIQLPATQANAFSLAAPTVTNTGTTNTAVTVADATEVNNLRFVGGETAVGSAAFNIGNGSVPGPLLVRNLEAANTTGSAIVLNSRARIDTEDVDNDGDTSEVAVEFDVDIDDVVLTNIGDDASDSGILINADDQGLSDSPDVALAELITIDDVTITGGAAVGIRVENTNATTDNNDFIPDNDDGVVIDSFEYDAASTGATGLVMENSEGVVVVSNSEITGDEAVSATNVASASLSGVTAAGGITVSHTGAEAMAFSYVNSTVTIADSAATAAIIDVTASGSGEFDFLASQLTINSTDADRAGVEVALSGAVTDADISVVGSQFGVQGAQAFGLDANTTNAAAVRFELSSTTLTSTNAVLGDVSVSGTSTLDATVLNNTFNLPAAGSFGIEQAGVSTTNLRLENTVIAVGAIDLTSAAGSGNFVIDAATDDAVQSSNNNSVQFNGAANAGADFTFDSTLFVTPPNN